MHFCDSSCEDDLRKLMQIEKTRWAFKGKEKMMEKKYDLIVFDMDGTILDTLEDLTDSMNAVLQMYHYEARSIDEIRSFVGNGLYNLVRLALPEGKRKEHIQEVLSTMKEYYGKHNDIKTKPYDGILDLIRRLRTAGYQTAVVSNKIDSGVQALCEVYYKGLFDVAIGEKDGIARKPAPDMVYAALDALGVDKTKAVYVGDSEVDLATAANAGLDMIAVGWGFRGEKFLKEQGAVKVYATPEEVGEYLGV